jgi:hypothetical protein
MKFEKYGVWNKDWLICSSAPVKSEIHLIDNECHVNFLKGDWGVILRFSSKRYFCLKRKLLTIGPAVSGW